MSVLILHFEKNNRVFIQFLRKLFVICNSVINWISFVQQLCQLQSLTHIFSVNRQCDNRQELGIFTCKNLIKLKYFSLLMRIDLDGHRTIF